MAASLFKLWLRELEEPLIPTALYNDALIASKDYAQVVEIVQKLPVYNRRVLVFVVGFVQIFMQEKVVEKTKMGPMNLGTFSSFNIQTRARAREKADGQEWKKKRSCWRPVSCELLPTRWSPCLPIRAVRANLCSSYWKT